MNAAPLIGDQGSRVRPIRSHMRPNFLRCELKFNEVAPVLLAGGRADMKRSIVDYFKKKNVSEEETNEAVVGAGEGLAEEAKRISDSYSEEDSDRLAKEAGGSGEKKKSIVFNKNGWRSSRGCVMRDKPWCVYCRTCGPSVAGKTHFVNGSTQFKVQSLKLHNESQKHKTCRDRCIT